jgi:hypothetical protein
MKKVSKNTIPQDKTLEHIKSYINDLEKLTTDDEWQILESNDSRYGKNIYSEAINCFPGSWELEKYTKENIMPIVDFLSEKKVFLTKGILSLDKVNEPDAEEDSISQQSTVNEYDKKLHQKLHPIIEPISEIKFLANKLGLITEIKKINSLAQILQQKMSNNSEYSKLLDDNLIDPNPPNDLDSTFSLFEDSVGENVYTYPEFINKDIKEKEEEEKSIRKGKDLQVKKPLDGKTIKARIEAYKESEQKIAVNKGQNNSSAIKTIAKSSIIFKSQQKDSNNSKHPIITATPQNKPITIRQNQINFANLKPRNNIVKPRNLHVLQNKNQNQFRR